MRTKELLYNTNLLDHWKRITFSDEEKRMYFAEEYADDFYRLVEEYALMWHMMHFYLERSHVDHLYAEWIIPKHGLWTIVEHVHKTDECATTNLCGLSLPISRERTWMFALNHHGVKCGKPILSGGRVNRCCSCRRVDARSLEQID